MKIYLMTNAKRLTEEEVKGIYVLSAETAKGEATISKEEQFRATKNAAELKLLIMAIERITKPCEVEIYTESPYLAIGFQYLKQWERNEWKTQKGETIKNNKQWQQVAEFAKVHRCTIFLQCHHPYKEWMKDTLREQRRYE